MAGYEQIPKEDALLDRDALDEGYSPLERRRATHDVGPTAAEQRAGETIEQRLAQEEPEPGLPAAAAAEQWEVDLAGDQRAGRLVAPDEGAHPDTEKDLVALDVGIDGGAASAEEAAMHVIPEDRL
jgi:hypothetical protein